MKPQENITDSFGQRSKSVLKQRELSKELPQNKPSNTFSSGIAHKGDTP